MKEPVTLPDHIEAVMRMEDSEFCRMFSVMKSQEQKWGKQSTGSSPRYTQTTTTSTWKPNTSQSDTAPKQPDKQQQTRQNDKANGQVKLSDAEYEFKKRNGLCYKCPEKWSKTHSFKNKQMQIMVVSQGCDTEVVEEEFYEAMEGEVLNESIELSLHSFLGWSL